jgi:hypothetical protein
MNTVPGSRILYCHCAYANVVPPAVKAAVLEGLVKADSEFDAVPDLCEMAAHGDGRLRELAAGGGPLRIAACYPRAVKWLFASSGAPLPGGARVWNMRVETADAVVEGLLSAASTPDGTVTESVA